MFVETDADERILRRVRRNVGERGRSVESIIEQYLTTVKPMHYRYIEPTKQYADIIINGGFNDVAFDLFKTKIENFLTVNHENGDAKRNENSGYGREGFRR